MNTNELLQEINTNYHKQVDLEKKYDEANDVWWNSLSNQEREHAFYAVVKRIYKAELEDHGTYRYALYDIFKFTGSMYLHAINCGYKALHEAINPNKE